MRRELIDNPDGDLCRKSQGAKVSEQSEQATGT